MVVASYGSMKKGLNTMPRVRYLTSHPSCCPASTEGAYKAQPTGPHWKVAHKVPYQTRELGDTRKECENRTS
jgi:hypothetical protein